MTLKQALILLMNGPLLAQWPSTQLSVLFTVGNSGIRIGKVNYFLK